MISSQIVFLNAIRTLVITGVLKEFGTVFEVQVSEHLKYGMMISGYNSIRILLRKLGLSGCCHMSQLACQPVKFVSACQILSESPDQPRTSLLEPN